MFAHSSGKWYFRRNVHMCLTKGLQKHWTASQLSQSTRAVAHADAEPSVFQPQTESRAGACSTRFAFSVDKDRSCHTSESFIYQLCFCFREGKGMDVSGISSGRSLVNEFLNASNLHTVPAPWKRHFSTCCFRVFLKEFRITEYELNLQPGLVTF